MTAGVSPSAVGSVWHRWDPHLHAPGTLLNDQFGGDWASYLSKINEAVPKVRALGVTDYFCIQTYKAARARWLAGELPAVGLLFPNVEMRLDIKTEKKKAINLHLLFSPDDPQHETEIERLLSRLRFSIGTRDFACTRSELIALGRFANSALADRRLPSATGRISSRPPSSSCWICTPPTDGFATTASLRWPAVILMAPLGCNTTIRTP